MKKGFTTMATPGYSIRKILDLAVAHGYDGVDIRISDHMGELNINSSDGDINFVKNAFKQSGVTLSSIMCYNSVGINDSASWDAMADSILKNMEISQKLEAPYIRIFGPDPSLFESADECIQHTAEVVSRVLENRDFSAGILIQHHLNALNAGQCIDLAARISNPRFGLIFSPDHCVLQRENSEEIYPGMIKYARQMYIADIVLSDGEAKPVLPGKGIVPFKEAYDRLGGREFDGFVTLKWEKIWHSELEEAETVLPYFFNLEF